MSTFNPYVHTAMYHNSNPFVLVEYTKRFKRCRGCMSKFDNPKFVIRNEEWTYVYGRRYRLSSRKRRVAERSVYFHCNPSCILPRHPYFKSREITTSPSLFMKLSATDIELLKTCGLLHLPWCYKLSTTIASTNLID